MRDSQVIGQLARSGVILPNTVQNVSTPLPQYAMDAASLAPTQIGSTNGAIPSFLTTYVDPKVIETIVAPMAAATLVGETKKGDWTTLVAAFIQAEPTVKVATYGDYSAEGSSGTNVNYPQRQSYFFQTWTRWGERELEMAGAGRVDLASQLNYASALGIAKFLNASYLYGISGLQNYGLTNDPRLPAASTSSQNWATAAPDAIFNAIISDLWKPLVQQSQGVIRNDDDLALGMPPSAAVDLNRTNLYGLSAMKLLKEVWKNLEIVEVPEYDSASGRLVQMWARKIEGTPVAECAFTEKMRAHAVERYSSYFRQKKSAGTWGAVVYRPFGMSQTLGV